GTARRRRSGGPGRAWRPLTRDGALAGRLARGLRRVGRYRPQTVAAANPFRHEHKPARGGLRTRTTRPARTVRRRHHYRRERLRRTAQAEDSLRRGWREDLYRREGEIESDYEEVETSRPPIPTSSSRLYSYECIDVHPESLRR